MDSNFLKKVRIRTVEIDYLHFLYINEILNLY